MKDAMMHGRAQIASAATRASGRFVTLDAMRGLAALAVVSSHFSGRFTGWEPHHSQLAVDLFYVLSGFVLAFAYDARLAAGMSVGDFMRRRFIRLAPLFILGLLIGLVAELAHRDRSLDGWHLPVAFTFNALLFPSPYVADNGNAFPIDQTFWSLFFELWIANLAYAVLWKRLHSLHLYALIALAGAGLAFLARRNGIAGGWNYSSVPIGFCRCIFSFFIGVALSRFHTKHPHRLILPAPLIVAAEGFLFWAPHVGRLSVATQLATVLLLFPALILIAAEASHMSHRLGKIMGDASYAAYVIHFPLLTFCSVYALPLITRHRMPAQAGFIVAVIALSVAAAAWDERIRGAIRTRSSAPSRTPIPAVGGGN